MRVFADWVKEGDAASALEQIIPEARLVAGREIDLIASALDFDRFNNVGLPAAVSRLRLQPVRLPPGDVGSLTPFLQRQSMHRPAFMVAESARWTLNALALGYSFPVDRAGILMNNPEPGYYATLMAGLETLAKSLTVLPDIGESEPHYAYNVEGIRYLTTRPGMSHAVELKR
jgi:hypothetical protein